MYAVEFLVVITWCSALTKIHIFFLNQKHIFSIVLSKLSLYRIHNTLNEYSGAGFDFKL